MSKKRAPTPRTFNYLTGIYRHPADIRAQIADLEHHLEGYKGTQHEQWIVELLGECRAELSRLTQKS